jgi:hypothetical protein
MEWVFYFHMTSQPTKHVSVVAIENVTTTTN